MATHGTNILTYNEDLMPIKSILSMVAFTTDASKAVVLVWVILCVASWLFLWGVYQDVSWFLYLLDPF